MTKIAILCEDDCTWGVPTWQKTLKELKSRSYSVAGFWTCPERLSSTLPGKAPAYYLKVFGMYSFVKLALFAMLVALARIVRGDALSFARLTRKFNIPHHKCQGPNDPEFIGWITENDIEILVIMIGDILEDEILAALPLGIINKHASLLPANRGLLPGFWAALKGQDQGVTLHTVEKKLDSGKILVQKKIDHEDGLTLIGFYHSVFNLFPEMLCAALSALETDDICAPEHGYSPSYQGLPNRADYIEYMKKGESIVKWKDLLLALKL